MGSAVTPTSRKPFDMIFKRDQFEEWSALVDDFRTFAHDFRAFPLQDARVDQS
jgi:hypothetical protein